MEELTRVKYGSEEAISEDKKSSLEGSWSGASKCSCWCPSAVCSSGCACLFCVVYKVFYCECQSAAGCSRLSRIRGGEARIRCGISSWR